MISETPNDLIRVDPCLKRAQNIHQCGRTFLCKKKKKKTPQEMCLIILNVSLASGERPGLLEGVMSTRESSMIHVLGLLLLARLTAASLLTFSQNVRRTRDQALPAARLLPPLAPHLTGRGEAVSRKQKFCLFPPETSPAEGSGALKALCVLRIQISEVKSDSVSGNCFFDSATRLLLSHARASADGGPAR